MKLLGVVISSNMKWNSHIQHMSKSANSKLWMLRRLKKLGAGNSILVDLYNKQIRSILEYAVPVWAPGLSKANIEEIERVQKSAFTIIFGPESYVQTLKKNKLKSLNDRRSDLVNKFALKSAKHPVFSDWFLLNKSSVNTRFRKKIL